MRKLCRIVESLLIDTLRKAEEYLGAKNIPSPRLEAQLIFSHFLKLRRIDLFTQSDRPLSGDELAKLREALKLKIAGTPTAYILGEKEFYGRTFKVTPDVLIPRPETEELVEHVLKEVSSANHVADLGTGSGCIGITLAHELKAPRVTLVDVSTAALEIARENANDLTSVACVAADFTDKNFLLEEKADVIVSNPPYVLPGEYSELDASVRKFEPRLALVADDFAASHKALIASAHRNLAPGGLLALETHPQKAYEVATWVENQGFVTVAVRNDLAARPHFVFARR